MSRLWLMCLVGLVSSTATLRAGNNVWTTHGPTGTDILSLVVDPSSPTTLYAGAASHNGIYKSTDGGASWRLSFATFPVLDLAIDPSSPGTIYAGTSVGVFKGTDGGASWSPANSGLTTTFVRALAVDPTTPGTLYAGTSTSLGGLGGVFKTTDGGESWSALREGLPDSDVRALVLAPSAHATLYACTSRGVFKTTNGGASWRPADDGPPGTGTHLTDVIALAIDPTNPDTLYAGTSFTTGGASKSVDGGRSWQPINSGLINSAVFSLTIDPLDSATVYAGTYGGAGVYVTRDGGKSWRPTGNGLTIPVVQAFAIDPNTPSTLYAGTFSGGGVFKSTDRGGSWSPANNGLSTGKGVRAFALSPSAPATLYAGANPYGVFKSTDAGGSWTFPSAGLNNVEVLSLSVDSSNPSHVYATVAWPVGWDFDVDGGVLESADGGASWSTRLRLSFTSVSALAVDPTAGRTLYAGGAGVYKSTDGGQSWGRTIPGGSPVNLYVQALAIDPHTPGTIYAGAGYYNNEPPNGVFKSTDAGVSWVAVNAGLMQRDVRALAIDPSRPSTIYAGTSDGVFKSTNAGESWFAVNTGLSRPFVQALAIDPSQPSTVYAGTSGAGVFRSTNGGASWTAMNAGLTNENGYVYTLAIDPSTPARIYAGTGGGVYEYLKTAEPCVPGPTTLCLSGGRFEVTTRWTTHDGQSGSGQAVVLPGGDTGYFTFFNRENVEVIVKILNGCSVNESYWTFAAGLTDVEVELTVTDTWTGTARSYSNPQGRPFAPIQDTEAFGTCAASASAGARPYGAAGGQSPLPDSAEGAGASTAGPCLPDSTTLCVSNSRYQVRTRWVTRDGASGDGRAISLTGDTGAFWFFEPSNVEVVIKVLDACGVNSRSWTFAAGLTDVNVLMTVTDTRTGIVKTYVNPQATAFQPIQDTNAFANCPQ